MKNAKNEELHNDSTSENFSEESVEPGSVDEGAAAAALMAAAPALAIFGMRKRLRGKHVKIK